MHPILRRSRVPIALLTCGILVEACRHPTAPSLPTDPPKITCPLSERIVSPLDVPISVVYGTATVAGGKVPISTTCTPASGSTFPIGQTTVFCTALDAQQRTDSCIFTVTVASPPRIGRTRFIAFGDSITYGEDGNSIIPGLLGSTTGYQRVRLLGSEYPSLLEQELKSRYTVQTSLIVVANDGLPGEFAGDSATLARFSSDVNSSYQVVLIMEGANDLLYGSAGEQRAITNLRVMIQRAKGLGIRPYLATLSPVDPNGFRGRDRFPFLADFNDRLRTLAASEAITLVDVYQAFGGDLTLISADGLHPNASGYQRIADTFFQSLKSTLEQ